MKTYYSSTTVEEKYFDVFGIIENVNFNRRTNYLKKGIRWCLDSGTFSRQFNESIWKNYVESCMEFKDTCGFVVIPDVVYNYKETLSMFFKHHSFPKDLGFKCAFVTQDGQPENEIPFELFDVLFIGGSNEHKLGNGVRNMIELAKSNKKKVHVGRVNSVKRINMFSDCDSWDGTTLSFEPGRKERFANCIRSLNQNENKSLR